MSGDLRTAVRELDKRFLLDYPTEAARQIEELETDTAVDELSEQTVRVLVPVFRRIQPSIAGRLIERLPESLAQGVISELLPRDATQILGTLEKESAQQILDRLNPAIRDELQELMNYPEDTAGFLMDTRIDFFRDSMSVQRALELLRRHRTRTARSLFLVGDDNELVAKVSIQDVAVADPGIRLKDIGQHPDDERREPGGKSAVFSVVRGAQATALVADQSADRFSCRGGRRAVRIDHREVHGSCGLAAGGGRTVGQRRCAGTGRHDARAVSAGNHAPAVAYRNRQRSKRGLDEWRRGGRDLRSRCLLLEPFGRPRPRHHVIDGAGDDCGRAGRRYRADCAAPAGAGSGAVVINHPDDRDGCSRFLLVSRHRHPVGGHARMKGRLPTAGK